jgi:hypothetical protein
MAASIVDTSEMIKSNANLYHVKQLLGHKSFETLNHYARLDITDLRYADGVEPVPPGDTVWEEPAPPGDADGDGDLQRGVQLRGRGEPRRMSARLSAEKKLSRSLRKVMLALKEKR